MYKNCKNRGLHRVIVVVRNQRRGNRTSGGCKGNRSSKDCRGSRSSRGKSNRTSLYQGWVGASKLNRIEVLERPLLEIKWVAWIKIA